MANKIMFVPFTIVSIVYCDDDADPAGAIGVRDEVSGTYGAYNSNVVVMSLRVATNLRAYGPFGRAESTSFTASGRVVGFFGRSGELLDSIGVYTA